MLSPQSQSGLSAIYHLWSMPLYSPCPVRSRFSWHHSVRGIAGTPSAGLSVVLWLTESLSIHLDFRLFSRLYFFVTERPWPVQIKETRLISTESTARRITISFSLYTFVPNRCPIFNCRIDQWNRSCLQSISITSPDGSDQLPYHIISFLSFVLSYVGDLSRVILSVWNRNYVLFFLLSQNETFICLLARLSLKWKEYTSTSLGFRPSFHVWWYWLRLCKF